MATVWRIAAAAAAIGAMINDHDAGSRKRRRIGSAEDYELTRVLGKGGFGVVVKTSPSNASSAHPTTAAARGGAVPLPTRSTATCCLRRATLRHAAATPPSSACTASRGTPHRTVQPRPGARRPEPGHVLRGRRGPFTEEETRRVLRQLLSGAGRMRERGIVHGDIQPGNIVVGGEGVVKICDLGLAVSMASAPPPRGQAGTLWYMAPEMLLGKADYDELVDALSLGCVMAELLAGEPLIPGHSATDQLLRIFRVVGGACVGYGSTPTAARLRELFPEERLSLDGFEVLDGLLTCDPGERLPAAMALQCPWFAGRASVPASAAYDACSATLGK
ncbi:hypothetical protein VPH35_125113 [Triticum aestivum]